MSRPWMVGIRFSRIAFWLLAVAGMVFGQTPTTTASKPLSFEVATIKPSGPLDPAAIVSGRAHVGMSIDQARVDIGNGTVMGLVCMAYKVRPYQIAGNPDWMSAGLNTDRYDILAKMPAGANKDQVPEMMQSLLAERFKLTVHREKRDTPVYVLVVGKNGPKLKEAVPETPVPAPAPGDEAATSAKPAAGKGEISFGGGDNRVTMKQSNGGMVINSKETGTMRMKMGENGNLRMEGDSMTMEMFATTLSQYLDRPVVDQTELKGKYQVALEISRDALLSLARKAGVNPGMMPGPAANPSNPAEAASDPSGSLFGSVQQLGLKLESRKVPYEFIVIDHVERTPTEN